jgi:hypothetical protein
MDSNPNNWEVGTPADESTKQIRAIKKMAAISSAIKNEKTYAIFEDFHTGHDAIYCFKCKMTSHNPEDVLQKYCGKCNEFHQP